jgi:hypothetical protein
LLSLEAGHSAVYWLLFCHLRLLLILKMPTRGEPSFIVDELPGGGRLQSASAATIFPGPNTRKFTNGPGAHLGTTYRTESQRVQQAACTANHAHMARWRQPPNSFQNDSHRVAGFQSNFIGREGRPRAVNIATDPIVSFVINLFC